MEDVAKRIDQLNKTELGDAKLSKQEIGYLQSKERLWAKDVNDDLFRDIANANVGLIQRDKTLKSFLDGLLSAETYLVPNILKEINSKSSLKLPDTYFYGFKNKTPRQQYFAVVNLLLLAANNKKAYFVSQINENEDLKRGIQTGTFNYSTLKALHAFQKQGEHVSGRSKADCLIGKRTIQQLLAKIGIKEIATTAVVDIKFASSNATAKNKYDWNIDQQKQMDAIINDKLLNDIEKVKKILEVAKNTVEIGSDSLNKKYGSVSYMLTRISDKLMVDQTKDETDQIISLLSGEEALIKKYWNVNAAREFGATNSSIQKTNNWIDDLQQRKESILTQRTRAFEMMTAYNSYLREISQDVGGIDWLSPLKKPLIHHCNQVDNLLRDFYYNRKNFDLDEVQRLIKFVFNDPMSQNLEKYGKNQLIKAIQNDGGRQKIRALEYTKKRKELMNLLSNPRAWSDETKGKFLNILREMDKYDDANRFLPVSYETTDVIKKSTQDDANKAIFGNDGESEVDQQNLDLIKKDLQLINGLFDVDENGKYIHDQATDILNVLDASSTPQGGGDKPVRDVLKKAFPSLNTKDRIQRDFLGGNDYIDNLIKQIKEIKKNEKKTKNDIKKGFNATIQTLESLELAGTISNEGRTQLQNLRVNKDNLEPLVEKSYKEIVSNVVLSSIGHRFRKQVLDTYPNIFEKGSGSNVDLYANVVGAHTYLADDTVESLQNTIVQISIQLVIALASFGTANALLAAATGGTGVLARIFATSAGRGLVYRMLPFLTQTVFKTVAYTAVSSVATAGVYANDSSEIWGIIKQQRSPEAFFSNAAMMGILSATTKLAKIGTSIKSGQSIESFVVNNGVGRFIAKQAANTTTRVVSEEVSISVAQGSSKIAFGNGEFTTEDFISSVVQGIAFEMLPGVGELGQSLTKKVDGKTVTTFTYTVDGKTQTGTINEALIQLQEYNPSKNIKNLFEQNIKKVAQSELKGKKYESKELMTRERARDQKPPRTAEQLNDLKNTNAQNKAQLENKVNELESKYNELIAQREANWRSLDGEEKGIEQLNSILKKSNIITVDGVKHKYIGIKNGKAEFVEVVSTKKGQPKAEGNTLEVTSLEELLDPRFNLEPGNKPTNQGRVNSLNNLLGTPQKLSVLNYKIATIKSKIDQLELEKSRLTNQPNNPAGNDYFKKNKSGLRNKNIWINENEYTCGSMTESGDLNFKYTGGKKDFAGEKNFTISSFSQLNGKGQVNGFSDGTSNSGSNTLTKAELDNHKTIVEFFSNEKEYLAAREKNIQANLASKTSEIAELNAEKQKLETELPKSQARDEKIKQRAARGKEIQTEINKILRVDPSGKEVGDLASARRQLIEANRLDAKYTNELSQMNTEANKPKEANKPTNSDDNPNVTNSTQEVTAENQMSQRFDEEIISDDGITINGINYRLVFEENLTQNPQKIGRIKFIKNGKVHMTVLSKTFSLPDNAGGKWIRQEYNKLRGQYIQDNNVLNGLAGKVKINKAEDAQKKVEEVAAQKKAEEVADQKKAEEVAAQKKAEEVADQNKLENENNQKPLETEKNPIKKINKLVDEYKKTNRSINKLKSKKLNLTTSEIQTLDIEIDSINKKIKDLEIAQNALKDQLKHMPGWREISGQRTYSDDKGNARVITLSTNEKFDLWKKELATDNTNSPHNVSTDMNNVIKDFEKNRSSIDEFQNAKKLLEKQLSSKKSEIEKEKNKIDAELSKLEETKKSILDKLDEIPGWKETSGQKVVYKKEDFVMHTSLSVEERFAIWKNKANGTENKAEAKPDVKVESQSIEKINNDFSQKVDVVLKNQEIDLDFEGGTSYRITAGEQKFIISKLAGGSYTLSHTGEINGEVVLSQRLIQVGTPLYIGRGSFEGSKKDKFMSSRHFEVNLSQDGKLTIKDLNSSNGSKIEKYVENEVKPLQQSKKGTEVKTEKTSSEQIKTQEAKEQNASKNSIRGDEIITVKTPPERVIRSRDIISVGDLHGEIGALEGNLLAVDLVTKGRNGLEWKGGDRKVVLLGDIMGDRGSSSFEIFKKLSSLREQAQKQGGDIDIIAGNHEDFVFGYLMKNRLGNHASGIQNAIYQTRYRDQGVGILEFLEFSNRNINDLSDPSKGFDMLNEGGETMRNSILDNMRKDPTGKLILNEIANMKIVNQINDALYIHTIPTNGILTTLETYGRSYGGLANGIKEINNLFQRGLKSDLLGEGQLSAQEWSNLNNIMDAFLHTNNRTDIEGLGGNQFFSYLNNNGINFIEHGHESHGGNITYIKNMQGEDMIRIRDNDYGYGKKGKNFTGTPSVNVFEKNLVPVPAL